MVKKTYLKHRFKVLVLSILTFTLLTISIYLIYSSLNIKTVTNKTLLTYNENSNIDYKVYLKPNNYFTEPYLESGKQYISSIIDYIDINYKYALSASKDFNASYKYKIVATINAAYKVDTNNVKQVWSKEYVLKESELINKDNYNNFIIDENIQINYDEYNTIINNFKKDYMLSVDSSLNVALLVYVAGEYVPADKAFNINETLNVEIPLSQQTINIKSNFKENNNNNIVQDYKVGRFNNLFVFFSAIVMLIIGLIILTITIVLVIREDRKQSKYIKNLRKILHDYGDIIVEAKNAPELVKDKSIEVKSFNELVNAQIEVKAPIVFSEIKINEKGLFVLIDKETIYYYYLKAEDYNNSKGNK